MSDINRWVTRWEGVEDQGLYVVATLVESPVSDLRLSYPIRLLRGFVLKRQREGEYAAFPVPEFKGLTPQEE